MKKNLLALLIIVTCSFCSNPPHEKITLASYKSIDSTVTFRGVFGIDKSTAYVSGSRGAFYKTADGGESWTNINVELAEDADFRDIHVFPNGSILLMSVGMGNASKILRSNDEGTTWDAVYENPYEEGFLNSIAFWNNNDGIAIGDPVEGHLFVIITKDGGITWHEIDRSKIPPALEGEAGFAASGTCVAVAGNSSAWIGTGGPAARIFKTTDMGETWTVHNTPIISGENTTGIYSVYFENEQNGFVLGGDYTNEPGTERTIAYTFDGGETWELSASQDVCFQSATAKLKLKDKCVYISTGPAGTYKSIDGKDFTKLSDIGFHCLAESKDNKVIWAAGSHGRVAKIGY